MSARDARDRLKPLIGTELGTSDWTALSPDRIEMFGRAIGQANQEVPTLLILALIPGLTSSIQLPIEAPGMAVNYGLERCRVLALAKVGDRLRARATLLGVEAGLPEGEEGRGWLLVKREVVVENEAAQPVLEAETLTRLLW